MIFNLQFLNVYYCIQKLVDQTCLKSKERNNKEDLLTITGAVYLRCPHDEVTRKLLEKCWSMVLPQQSG